MTFEESIKKLSEINEKLESGELSLEESMKLYQEGIELSYECKKELENAQLKITQFEESNSDSGRIDGH